MTQKYYYWESIIIEIHSPSSFHSHSEYVTVAQVLPESTHTNSFGQKGSVLFYY